MNDPGYGPNGERLPAVGLVSWRAAAPPEVVTEGEDTWIIYALGETHVPFVSQADDEAWTAIELEIPFPVVADNLTWDSTDNMTWDATDNVTWN